MDASAFSVAPAPAAPARPLRGGRRWPSRCASGLLYVSIGLALVVALAASFGLRTAVVLTGSMRPALAPDDMLLTKRIQAAEAKPGDIVSFAAPQAKGVIITHRVKRIAPAAGGQLAFVTQGDANNAPERWKIRPEGSMGRVVGVIPGVGALTGWTGDAAMRLAVFGFIGLLLLAYGLRWVWRDR